MSGPDTRSHELLVECPACAAPVGKPCTVPTTTSRREVSWFHLRREEAAKNKIEYMVEYTDGGGEAQCAFYANRATADAIAKEHEGSLYEVRPIANYEVERD